MVRDGDDTAGWIAGAFPVWWYLCVVWAHKPSWMSDFAFSLDEPSVRSSQADCNDPTTRTVAQRGRQGYSRDDPAARGFLYPTQAKRRLVWATRLLT